VSYLCDLCKQPIEDGDEMHITTNDSEGSKLELASDVYVRPGVALRLVVEIAVDPSKHGGHFHYHESCGFEFVQRHAVTVPLWSQPPAPPPEPQDATGSAPPDTLGATGGDPFPEPDTVDIGVGTMVRPSAEDQAAVDAVLTPTCDHGLCALPEGHEGPHDILF
jgi:hypothetical protein